MSNIVAIIGKPNVGKSTLFNRIIKERLSIVEDLPGVTRDRIYAHAEWLTRKFLLIDTGGITLENVDFQQEIKFQALIAVQEADVILFVVSYKDGITADDREIAKLLFRSNKKVILVVNKYDKNDNENLIYDYMQLGFGEAIPISSTHGIGVGDLLDKTVSLFNSNSEKKLENRIYFSIIGKPNSGKSSLVNAILNEERVIVSEKAGTTTDAIDSLFSYNKNQYVVVDTAGIRQKSRIVNKIEKYSLIRSIKAIDKSDIVLLTLDCTQDISDLDTNIGGLIYEANKPAIIVLNKIDLLKNKDKDFKKITEKIKNSFKYLGYANIIFVSALKKEKISKLLAMITTVYESLQKRIKTSILNEILVKAQLLNPAPDFNGGRLKIYYSSQPSTMPPTFILFVNNKNYLHFSYKRYIENQIRSNFDFNGVPISLLFRTRK